MIRRPAGWDARRTLGAFVCATLAALLWVPSAVADQTSDEIKLGAEIVKQIESRYRVVTNPAQVERVTRIGDVVARVVDRQDLTYRFKILDISGVNALSLPGGWVYVTEGMMKFVRTDDELAAVLAHELTHVAHRHYFIQQERAKNMLPATIIAAALSVLAHSAVPLIGVEMATQGALANYQRDLEKEADLTGVAFLTKTGYSPVAMLTLMEHLAQADRLSGRPDPSGLEDHPEAGERVVYIRTDLVRRGIPLVRRKPEGYLKLAQEPPTPAAGQPVTILVDREPILTIAAAVSGLSAAERAQAVYVRLDRFFDRDPAPFDVRAVSLPDRWAIIGGETVLFEITSADAEYAHLTPGALAGLIRARLAHVIAAAPYNRKF